MLMKNPLKRPHMSQVLDHPFLSGKKATRMLGESAQFDVFLSYRKQSDESHASLLYNRLTAAGLSVWWDKKSLIPGVPWQASLFFLLTFLFIKITIIIITIIIEDVVIRKYSNSSNSDISMNNCKNLRLVDVSDLEIRLSKYCYLFLGGILRRVGEESHLLAASVSRGDQQLFGREAELLSLIEILQLRQRAAGTSSSARIMRARSGGEHLSRLNWRPCFGQWDRSIH